MHTTFLSLHNGKTIHIPHSEISAGYVENLSRTPKRQYVKSVVLQMGRVIDLEELQSLVDYLERELPKRECKMQSKKDPFPILRFHRMPEVSSVPMKPEDPEKKGVRVEFHRKQWVCLSIKSHVVLIADLFRFLTKTSKRRKNVEKKCWISYGKN
jgi:hypothetical protein